MRFRKSSAPNWFSVIKIFLVWYFESDQSCSYIFSIINTIIIDSNDNITEQLPVIGPPSILLRSPQLQPGTDGTTGKPGLTTVWDRTAVVLPIFSDRRNMSRKFRKVKKKQQLAPLTRFLFYRLKRMTGRVWTRSLSLVLQAVMKKNWNTSVRWLLFGRCG